VLGYQPLCELELRLHDREPILLEHEGRSLVIAERLPLANEHGNPSLQGVARRSGVAHLHMLSLCRRVTTDYSPDGWTWGALSTA
jgi:hypothetical protein